MQSALLRCLFLLLLVFPLLYSRSMYHVPSVLDVTRGQMVLVVHLHRLVRQCYSNKDCFDLVTSSRSNEKILMIAELS